MNVWCATHILSRNLSCVVWSGKIYWVPNSFKLILLTTQAECRLSVNRGVCSMYIIVFQMLGKVRQVTFSYWRAWNSSRKRRSRVDDLYFRSSRTSHSSWSGDKKNENLRFPFRVRLHNLSESVQRLVFPVWSENKKIHPRDNFELSDWKLLVKAFQWRSVIFLLGWEIIRWSARSWVEERKCSYRRVSSTPGPSESSGESQHGE